MRAAQWFGLILAVLLVLATGPELWAASPAGRSARAAGQDSPRRSQGAVTLRQLSETRGLLFGVGVGVPSWREDPSFAPVVSREFSSLTPENVMKFEHIHPGPNRYDFADADALVAFAEQHQMRVHGHTLVWDQQLPRWMKKSTFSRDELIEVMREHITTVVGRYKGRVMAWDVVNEAFEPGGPELRASVWQHAIGPEYVELAFQFAHQADPDALLFYNDFGGEALGEKSDAIYALVKDLKARGVPVHGVGLQAHLTLGDTLSRQEMAANINRLGELSLEVRVTELDVKMLLPASQQQLAAQAEVYGAVVGACLDAPACKAITVWNLTDRHSWIPYFDKRSGAAHLFDQEYRPKPAYRAVQEVLRQR